MAKKIVCARRTYDVNCLVTLPGPDDVSAMLLRGAQMKVTERRDGGADLVIKGSLRDFPAVQVNEWYAKHRCGKCR